jgi:protease I
MAWDLTGKRVAILATDGFEESELLQPLEALRAAGAEVDIVSPEGGTIRGWSGGGWADPVHVDRTVADASADDYDGLLLPGGVMNPDHLRMDADAVGFVRDFFEAAKPVAAICHGPWLLVEAGVASGRTVTSYPSLRTDLENAGATWVDEAVVTDHGLVTSRNPDDLPVFVDKMLEEFHEGAHAGQHG